MDLLNGEIEVGNCLACGCSMDVSTLAPFTNVQCPECGEHTRVKCQVGGYELKKRQGVGGMSLVFGAIDKTLGREVAIKILNEEYSMDEKRIAEFEKEAQITAAISHPHVVRVYTVGQAFERFYIAMELVNGDSLEQMMTKQGSLNEAFVADLASQVVEGLQAAHHAGLIHRDVKPGNILIDKNGHAKIVDFGLALVTQGGKAMAEEIWATPFYVPPETLEMKEEDLRSDIYALGASIYHALSGEPPFSTETRSTSELLQIKREIPPMSKTAPWVNPNLATVIDRAMAFEADERYQNYEELHDALKHAESCIRNGDVSLPQQNDQRVSKRRTQKQKLVTLSASGAVALTLAVAIWLGMGADKSDPKDTIADSQVEEQGADGVDSEAKNRVIAAQIRGASTLLRQRKYGMAYERFMALSSDPAVPVETAYWAGMKSVIAAWADGRSGDARRSLRQIRKLQNDDTGAKDSEMHQKLNVAYRLLSDQRSIKLKDFPQGGDYFDEMILFAGGLKSWEAGRWDTAEKIFLAVKASPIDGDREDRRFYRQLADGYLYDLELLSRFQKGFQPLTVQEAKRSQSKLLEAKGKLKTRGRSHFNVSQWQRQLSLEMVKMEQEINVSVPDKRPQIVDGKTAKWDAARERVDAAISEMDFAKASSELKLAIPLNQQDLKWRNQMIYMCDSASGFLHSIYQDVKGKSGQFTIRHRNTGEVYSRLEGAEEAGLHVLSKGEAIVIFWREIDAKSMLDLHTKLTATGLNDFEKRLRLEQAIAYAWLSGEVIKAEVAANKLSDENPIFKRRWESCMKVLGNSDVQ